MSRTDVFDVSGLVLLALFGFSVWPPAALLVFGVGLLAASRADALRKAEAGS